MRQRVVLAALMLSVAACSDEATRPVSSNLLSMSAAGGQGGGRRFMPNSVPYGNGGVHPATGRSGSAAITASAVFGGTGTVLTVKSFHRDDLSYLDPTGDIVKLQVKAFSASGALLWTRNFNNLAPASSIRNLTFTDVPAGARLQVQANVRAIDPRRTDVVITSAFVVARPANLRVTNLDVPNRWLLNTPLQIIATVAETGGDLNVTANCALYVDGTKVQQISNMLVLAGDTVTCNFAYTFTTVAEHEVRVKVESMMPGDNNSTDNQVAAGVNVYSEGGVALPVFSYDAEVGDVTVDTYDSTYTVVMTLGTTDTLEFSSYVSGSIGREQTSLFSGIYKGHIEFPVAQLVLEQRSGGSLLHSLTLTGAESNSPGITECLNGGSNGIEYSLCTYPGSGTAADPARTTIFYRRVAGTVSYRSQAYNHLFDETECTGTSAETGSVATDCWVSNDQSATVVPWSGSLDFNVSITAGDTTYAAAPVIPLTVTATDSTWSGCDPVAFLADTTYFGSIPSITNYEVHTCRAGRTIRTGVVGGVNGGIGITELN